LQAAKRGKKEQNGSYKNDGFRTKEGFLEAQKRELSDTMKAVNASFSLNITTPKPSNKLMAENSW